MRQEKGCQKKPRRRTWSSCGRSPPQAARCQEEEEVQQQPVRSGALLARAKLLEGRPSRGEGEDEYSLRPPEEAAGGAGGQDGH